MSSLALKRFALGMTALAGLAGCQAAPKPDPTGLANPEMTQVLAKYQELGAQPIERLSVEDARRQASLVDAGLQLGQGHGVGRVAVAKVTDLQVKGGDGVLPARLYDPQLVKTGPAPVILYFHGGGGVTGTLDSADAVSRILAARTGAIVVSVQYRQGPENRFPAAHDDADFAYQWVVDNAASFGGDPKAIALAGEGLGANLAIDTAIWARDHHLQAPIHELLIYPLAGVNNDTPSYQKTERAIPLNRSVARWYASYTTNLDSDLKDPRVDVVGRADVHGLPPTTIIAAEVDPLRSEDEALAEKLKASGVNVEERTYPGVTHDFFALGGIVNEATKAEDFAAQRLRVAFTPPPPVMVGDVPFYKQERIRHRPHVPHIRHQRSIQQDGNG